ncbi:MAG: NAD-dependent epimerase/dehydratase family protein [Methylococcaceae bacterium]
MNPIAKENWTNLRVLITGGSGFIGSHLCRRLCDKGCEVHATSRTEHPSGLDGTIWWQSDMSDIAAARRLLADVKPDIIFHLAGAVGAGLGIELVMPAYESLLTSTVNMLMAATEAGCHRVILTGSLTEPMPGPEPAPQSPYAAAKWAAAGYGRMFHSLYKTPAVILRPFMIYGPAQAANKLIPSVTLSLLKGEAPKVSSGKRRFDWLYIDDAIDGFLAAMVVPALEGATIDLGSGNLVSIADITERLVEFVGGQTKTVFGALPDRPGENEIVANTAVAYSLLGWTATTSLDKGLRQTVEWYRTKAAR